MTAARRRARIRGASSTGCLFSLLVFVALLFYGVNIGEVYFRYYRLLDEMESQSRIAAGLDNGTIARRIAAAVDDIGIPDSARNIVVRRTIEPREITISTDYSESVDLPFFKHTFVFHPKATQPL